MRVYFEKRVFELVAIVCALAGCAVAHDEGDGGAEGSVSEPIASFEEFAATVPYLKDPGVYVVEGDLALRTREDLREYWQRLHGQVQLAPTARLAPTPQLALTVAAAAAGAETAGAETVGVSQSALSVHSIKGTDQIWTSAQQHNITYCSTTSPICADCKAYLDSALANAAASWSEAADVQFVKVGVPEASCNTSNNNVQFNVRIVSDLQGPAALWTGNPKSLRSQRELLIDWNWFVNHSAAQLTGVLRHEFGHALGFRHEQTAGSTITNTPKKCYEDDTWRPLSRYDTSSVMLAPFDCGSTIQSEENLLLSTKDKNGAACLYGAAAGFTRHCTYKGILYRASTFYGWLPEVKDSNIAGTYNGVAPLEQLKMRIAGATGSLGICYRVQVEGSWKPEACDGVVTGSTTPGDSITALRIRLTNAPSGCHVTYQVASQVGSPAPWSAPLSDNATYTGYIRAIKVTTSPSCPIGTSWL